MNNLLGKLIGSGATGLSFCSRYLPTNRYPACPYEILNTLAIRPVFRRRAMGCAEMIDCK